MYKTWTYSITHVVDVPPQSLVTHIFLSIIIILAILLYDYIIFMGYYFLILFSVL